MIKYIFVFVSLILIQCNFNIESFMLDSNAIEHLDVSGINLPDRDCSSNSSNIPDSTNLYSEIVRQIRVNFHFVNNKEGSLNYNEVNGTKYANELLYHANRKLQYNKKMNLPDGNLTPNINPLYQYKLTESERGNGIYFHYDDELSYYVNEGARNNYNRDVVNKYSIDEDSILNIFYMIHHPDSVRSETYSASSAGIALGKSIKLGTVYRPGDKPWRYASLLNHEIGHVLGLSHSWNTKDGCDDTPKNSNCWSPAETSPCNGPVSNNMMDYNSNQNAITPCQIGKMRKNMARIGSKQRDLLIRDWCNLVQGKDIIINDNISFKGSKDLQGNIIINDGGRLSISCRISMPKNGEIIVNPGAELVLNGARIHNDCGRTWKGIRIMKKGKKIGKVYYMKVPVFENLEHESSRLLSLEGL